MLDIEAKTGDMLELAPNLVQVAALWLRGGFNLRHILWMKLFEKYGREMMPFPMVPWETTEDQFIHLRQQDGLLKSVYLFANPGDQIGENDLESVEQAMNRCLNACDIEKAESVAFLQIPVLPLARRPGDKDASARAMLRAIRSWSQKAQTISNVYLIDFDGDFGKLLKRETL